MLSWNKSFLALIAFLMLFYTHPILAQKDSKTENKFTVDNKPVNEMISPLPGQWQCKAMDKAEKTWYWNEEFFDLVNIKTLEICKKNSASPRTCEIIGCFKNDYPTNNITPPSGYWLCKSYDNKGRMWYWNNVDRIEALQNVLESCRKNSSEPDSCEIERYYCFNESPEFWQCRATDSSGNMWFWKNSDKEEAAIQARKACEYNSLTPVSCVTSPDDCKNFLY